MTEERSDEAVVDVRELRFDAGVGRTREGGGGGGGFVCAVRIAYGTDVTDEDDEDDPTPDRCGSLGGSGLRMNSCQSVETEETLGLTTDDADTFSNDSSKLMLSGSRVISGPWSSRSMGYVATKFVSEPGVCRSVPPSEDRETE